MFGIMIDNEPLLILSVPILLFLIVTRILVQKKKRKTINIIKELTIFILGIYILLLIGVTLLPIHISLGVKNIRELFMGLNLIPFKSIINDINSIGSNGLSIAFDIELLIINVVGNLILLTPLGILTPMLWKKLRNFKNCVLLGIITSATIEITQLIENYFKLGMRTVDIDDLILNVLGIAIGYLIFKIIFNIKIESYFETKNNIIKDTKY